MNTLIAKIFNIENKKRERYAIELLSTITDYHYICPLGNFSIIATIKLLEKEMKIMIIVLSILITDFLD